ncbi:MAG: enoyl-CoA hydratase, partial [Betaproteobacteria bacterium]
PGAADGGGLSLLLASGLMLLARAAALALCARAAGIVPASGGAGVLWYVLVLGGIAGAVGTAAAGRRVAAGP